MTRLKMIMVGDYGSGKTSLVHRYIHKQFSNFYKATIGVDITSKSVQVAGLGEVEAQVWDIAGQDNFAKVRSRFYQGASAAIVVFDLTRLPTFENISNWISEIKKDIGKIPMVLVGNKSDLTSQRGIAAEELQKFAEENGIQAFETSAKTGEKVENVFSQLVGQAIETLNKDSAFWN